MKGVKFLWLTGRHESLKQRRLLLLMRPTLHGISPLPSRAPHWYSNNCSQCLNRFSDVTHEFQPVSVGRRLVLTYNLVHSTLGPDVLAAGSNKSMAKLDLLFSYWKESVEDMPETLAYLLKDEVEAEKLSYNALNGEDLQVVKHLRESSKKHGFCIYLASLKRSIKTNDEDMDDWPDSAYEREIDQSEAESTLQRVVELDGTEIAKGMNFEDNLLIQEDPFEGVEPDDEECPNGQNAVVYFRTV